MWSEFGDQVAWVPPSPPGRVARPPREANTSRGAPVQLEAAMSIRPPSRANDRPGLLARGGYFPARRFKVVLHKPAHADLMFVARVVMELTRFGSAEAPAA